MTSCGFSFFTHGVGRKLRQGRLGLMFFVYCHHFTIYSSLFIYFHSVLFPFSAFAAWLHLDFSDCLDNKHFKLIIGPLELFDVSQIRVLQQLKFF